MNNEIKLIIGADHRGYMTKELIKEHLAIDRCTITWIDVGAYNRERSDYPVFAQLACRALQEKKAEQAILLCGSGIGMGIAANRFPGIYAGVAWNTTIARLSKEDDNTNILIIPSDFVEYQEALEMIKIWLSAEFKEDRYRQRLTMIDPL